MTVFEILDILNVHKNDISIYDLNDNSEVDVELSDKGWYKQPIKYNEFAHRNVFGITLIGKTFRIFIN